MANEQGATPRTLLDYRDRVVPALVNEFGFKNVNQAPRIDKIVVNIGMGEALQNANSLEAATRDIGIITGQKTRDYPRKEKRGKLPPS